MTTSTLPTRTWIAKTVRRVLEPEPNVRFALLFGSWVKGQPAPFSDVDVAVYLAKPWMLEARGLWTARLEMALGRDVDLGVLNEWLKYDPALAYTVLWEGELLFCRDEREFLRVRHRALMVYLDMAPLYRMFHARLRERLMNPA